MTDSTGEVTYSARYTPWGDTLDTYGTGNFAFGYFGGLMDNATGLLYVGNGQYYDPEIGKFLTRNPNASGNPYLPFDPTGALFVPLAFASLVYGKKKKKSKWDILIIITLLSLSAGMGVAACGSLSEGEVTATVTATPDSPVGQVTITDSNGTTIQVSTPVRPDGTPTAIPSSTCTPTPTSTPGPTPTLPFPTMMNEDRFTKIYNALMDSQYQNHWWRQMDNGTEMILAVLSYLELRTIASDSGFINAATEALTNRYQFFCRNHLGCEIKNGNIPKGLQSIMRFSHSLMQIEHGVSRDLDQSSIDSAFAIKMGETVARDTMPFDLSRPYGWFNPQSDQELNYFNGKKSFMGDTDPYHIYWWAPDGKIFNPMDLAIVLTKWQIDTLCNPSDPKEAKYVKCGNN